MQDTWSYTDRSPNNPDCAGVFLCLWRNGYLSLMFTEQEARKEVAKPFYDAPAHVVAEGIDWMVEQGYWS